jgi:hypothetical protein
MVLEDSTDPFTAREINRSVFDNVTKGCIIKEHTQYRSFRCFYVLSRIDRDTLLVIDLATIQNSLTPEPQHYFFNPDNSIEVDFAIKEEDEVYQRKVQCMHSTKKYRDYYCQNKNAIDEEVMNLAKKQIVRRFGLITVYFAEKDGQIKHRISINEDEPINEEAYSIGLRFEKGMNGICKLH